MARQEPEDWLLERYRLGEVTPEQRQRVDAALAADPAVRARLEALEADDAATLASHPPARVAASIRVAAEAPRSGRRMPAWWPVVAMVATGFTAVIAWQGVTEEDVLREKGAGGSLTLFKLTSQGPSALADGVTVKPGDVVQPKFRLDEPGYAVLVSFDALGQVTVHAAPPQRLEKGTVTTDRSFELDASPGFERFLLVVASTPIALDAVKARVAAVATSPDARRSPLGLPGTSERSLVLLKETP
jgi:anti-sigma factor RsiW